MTTVVLGIGQPTAGDDGVGLVVARALAARGLSAWGSTDASVILSLLGEGQRLVIVDAVVGGGAPGAVLRLDPGDLGGAVAPVSSHGVSVAEALAVAETLYGEGLPVEIVGIVIDGQRTVGTELSVEVAGAVGRAVEIVASLCV